MSKKFLIGIIVFILIWISLYLQINLLNQVPLFGVSANICIVIIVGIGLISGKIPGALVGMAYGILLDILYGKCFGIYTGIYAITGLLSGKLSNGFSKENKLSMIYMVALFTALCEGITYLSFVMIYGYSFEILPVAIIIFKEIIYNMILARLLFKPINSLGEIINKSKNSYYLL